MAFLKTIRLSGFKTFAKPTELLLEPGVTVIIGPNGSGKSNIADAVLWALGEQSPSVLRAKSMQDLVFAGTNGRKPASTAEVRLLFDNASGAFPEGFSEIEIVRRSTREGGSEYLINGVPRRLLDVQELISTVGLGREMHSVISQGKVEELLNASPRARRSLIEEAAGLGIYKRRRERTLSKLERVQANLDRVRDVEREVRAALRPLKAQMHAAQHHEELSERIAAEKAALALFELDGIERRVGSLRERIDIASARKGELEEELARLHDGRVREEERFAGAMREREHKTARYHRARSQVDWLESRAATARQRVARVEQECVRAARNVEATGAERQAAVAHLESVLALPGASVDRRSHVDEAAARIRASLAEIEDILSTAEIGEEELRDTFLDLEAKKSRERQQTEFLERELREAEERGRAQMARLEAGRAQAGRLTSERSGLAAAVEERRTQLEAAAAAERESATALQTAEEQVEGHSGRARQLQGLLDGMETRLEVLRAVLGRRAGLPEGVEHILRAETRARPLTELLDVTKGYERAVIAALGPLAQAASVSRDVGVRLVREVPGAVDLVLTNGWVDGSASAAEKPAEGEGAPPPAAALGRPPSTPGLVDLWAVIEGPPVLVEVLKRLVPRTWVAEDLDSAPVAEGDRVVTLGGELCVAGAYVGRHKEVAAETLLKAKREMEELTADIGRLRMELGELKRVLEETESHREACSEERRVRERAVRECRRVLAVSREELTAREKQHVQAEEELRQVEEFLEKHEDVLRGLESELGRLREGLEDVDSRLEEVRSGMRESRGRVERLRLQRSYLERKRTQASVLDIRLRERERAQGLELARAQTRLAESQSAEVGAVRRHENLSRLKEPAGGLARVTAELAESFRGALELLHDELEQSKHASAGFAATLKEQGRREGEVQRELTALGEELIAAQVAHAHAEDEAGDRNAELADLRRRHLSPREVRVEDLPGFDPASAHAKIEALGRRLEKIGPVNPLADREYSEASERAAFLQEQCSDLGQSVGELRRVLGDLEHHIETVFAEMFEKTRAHFADMTKTLFPEGRGVLRLQEELATGSTGEVECSNGEDEIPRAESSGRKAPGIHLEIEFPRKGAKTLTLLSGGEKALAAIGFLFSLFLARPCPFYVLDEVEAALDDHNIDRFLSLVKQYQRETQFIIITHQRRTMEIADILYGVTMEGDGVSRLLSRRLTEVRPPGVEAKAG